MSSWRDVPRLEAALLFAVLIAAVGGWFLFQERDSAQQEVVDAKDRAIKTGQAVESLTEEEVSLRAEVEGLEQVAGGAIAASTFPSRGDALQLSAQVAGYVAEQGVRVTAFDSGQTSVPLGEVEYPAIAYSLSASGSAGSLIGLLTLIDDVPTGVVQTLDVSRDPDASQQWLLNLILVIIYEG